MLDGEEGRDFAPYLLMLMNIIAKTVFVAVLRLTGEVTQEELAQNA